MKTRFKTKHAYSALTLLAAGLVLSFQNCGDGFVAKSLELGAAVPAAPIDPQPVTPAGTMDPPPVTPLAMTDRLVTDCLNDATFDGCVFYKNPVAQEGQPEGSPWYTSINSRQRYGVKLKNLAASGNLENASLKVMGGGGTVATLPRFMKDPSSLWRVSVNSEAAAADKGKASTQVSAYYWLTTYIDRLESSPFIQSTYSNGKDVTIYPYATVVDGSPWMNAAFFGGGTHLNNIIIGYGTNNTPLAFSGEVIIHEFTHALVYHAANATSASSASTHRYCLDQVQGLSTAQVQNSGICCQTAGGCMRAMNEGLADYFASTQFPENPVVGEGLMNSTAGLMTCGAGTPKRDARENAARTPASVFTLCKANISNGGVVTQVDRAGEQYTMASVYTSTLWEIRKNVKQAVPQITVAGVSIDGGVLFDSIVHEHLMSLTGSSTFVSSRTALKDAAAALIAAKNVQLPAGVSLSTIIDTEFTRRGIN